MRKNVILIMLTWVAVFTAGYLVRGDSPTVELSGTDDLFKTVAHIDLSDCEFLMEVYKDTDNDVAYYMYVGERDELKVGDKVHLQDGEEFEVTSIDVHGFTLAPIGTLYVDYGYSGYAVMNTDEEQVGVISATDGEFVYCIWT